MAAFYRFLYIAGSLGLLVYGMRMLSEGVQRSAGDRLQAILNHLTTNRFAAVMTGFLVTVLVQSSSATTVMIVSFVNATLLTLTQAVGAIMGANIGTTVTGWIVAVFGFSFDISTAALPAVGVGAFLVFNRRLRRHDEGEALIGFGLLFLGLGFLKDAVPDVQAHPELLERIAALSGHGMASILLFVLVGAFLTILVQSSSAAVTITLTMAYAGWIDYTIAAAIILGENIGTTVTANLAAMGGSVNGRRAARAHLVFNVVGVLWMLTVFHWVLQGVDSVLGEALLPTRLALFHTVFNVANTVLFIGFVPFLTKLATRMVPDEGDSAPMSPYRLPLPENYTEGRAELYLPELRYEVVRMAGIVETMIADAWQLFRNPSTVTAERLEALSRREDYTDQMKEQISHALAKSSFLSHRKSTTATAVALLRIVDELESIADSSYNVALVADRRSRKKIQIEDAAITDLSPYAEQVLEFAGFVDQLLLDTCSEQDLSRARELERQINAMRNQLKKSSRRRIQEGAGLKGELLVLDVISHLEHMGDYSLNIAEAIRQTKLRTPLKVQVSRAP
jgi:phosphate:Na+ symporter